MTRFRIVVVDDHALVRRGIIETFHDELDFEVVAQGACADDAVALVAAHKPDLVTLDVTMPGGGVEAAGVIHRSHPTIRIVMLSVRENPSTARAALVAGAHGYVVKGVDGAALVAVARKVLAGQHHVDTVVAAALEGFDGVAAPSSDPTG